MNTVLGLLAKGDQNCWLPEEQKPQNLFESGVSPAGATGTAPATPLAGSDPIQPRDPNTLPPGAVQTIAEIEAAKKAAAEKAEQEAEQKRIEEEERLRREAEANKKPGWGSKLVKWFGSLTDAEE